eukprot:256031_1
MSTWWQCESCHLRNASQRKYCQACFQIKPIQPPSRLHHKLTPESHQLKKVVVYGYFLQFVTLIIPEDIVRLCTRFYDEATYWTIESDQLQNCFTNKPQPDHISAPIFSSFHTSDIKLKFVFQPSINQDKDSILYIHYSLNEKIAKTTIFSTMFCEQNDAHFKQTLELYAPPRWGSWNMPIDGQTQWQTRQYMVLMHLDCKTLEEILICYHFEILSIEYVRNASLYYTKQISMPKQVEFRWKIGKLLIKKLKAASPRQLFLSDSFDEINNNWGLYIFPKDSKRLEEKQCKVGLALVLFKRPYDMKQFKVECVVKNSYNNIENKDIVNYVSSHGYRFVSPLFPSKDLMEVDEFLIYVKLSILSITNYDYSMTELSYEQWKYKQCDSKK